MIKRLAAYFKNYKLPAILCPVLMLFEVMGDVAMPWLMAQILNRVDVSRAAEFTTADIYYVLKIGGLMVLVSLIAMFCGAYSSRLAAIASQGAGAELREDLFVKIQKFSFSNIDYFSIPSLITRLTTDVNNLQQTGMMCLRMLVRSPFMFLFALIMSISIHAELACVFLIAIPLLTIAVVVIMKKAHPRFMAFQDKIDDLNTSVQENLTNIRVVKSFVRGDYEKKKFKKSNDDLTATGIRAVKLVILNMPIMQLIVYICIIAILFFGGRVVVDTGLAELTGKVYESTGLQAGDLLSLISYVTQILSSLMMLSMLFLQFTRARASGQRVLEVLDTKIDITDPENALTEVPDGSIDFENVSFRYRMGSGEDTLSGINLHIRSGETIGIIGSTGSAKTTLVQLIPRLYDVTEGRIKVGGHDVKEYALEPLHDAVAMVLQKNTLFSGTVRDNMRWGDPDASDEEIREACEHAQAWDFVSKLPEGLDTDLSQGGANLSGGQKQRLCIARALLKHPKIIILDDSTSAVDTATDAKIRQAFSEELGGITTLIIAQRITSISNADRIIVLDDGKINAVGTHEELMETNEIYRDVYTSQQEGVISE
ncbi:MAG TPA: ABC transporter ATP-binding protein [Candidatus Egerieisoma faecipullorum]|uniref:ABC transporter ATP-binding protein n=1 Tax=Candidatus Egerieisoma faecipullorum TaxID=2840963 RepID=A0A9D1I6S7_9CLOT|nr:ABC transporter ATP-binding protein [Candidatus Egerieisoma faecipullorum]